MREKCIRIQGGILAVLQFSKILLTFGKFDVTVSLNTKVNKAWVKFCDLYPCCSFLGCHYALQFCSFRNLCCEIGRIIKMKFWFSFWGFLLVVDWLVLFLFWSGLFYLSQSPE